MATVVVIGANTDVEFMGSYCFISASWGADPGRQDAFCLGSWLPSTNHLVYKPQLTANLTMYAPGPTYDTTPSEDCTTLGGESLTIEAGSCEGSEGVDGDNWQVNSYSYSKASKDVPAQETWSLIKYIGATTILTGDAAARGVEPTFVSRGITQGQSTNATTPTKTGILFDSTFAQSSSGNVSAGATGTATTTVHGIVSRVGGGSSDVADYGEGSASIPLTPIYI
jgi:hypothetical protein